MVKSTLASGSFYTIMFCFVLFLVLQIMVLIFFQYFQITPKISWKYINSLSLHCPLKGRTEKKAGPDLLKIQDHKLFMPLLKPLPKPLPYSRPMRDS